VLSLDRRARAHDVAPLPNALRRRKERRAPEQGTGVSGNQALADEVLSSRITRPLDQPLELSPLEAVAVKPQRRTVFRHRSYNVGRSSIRY
jgi:hypothetical protein